MQDEVVLTSVQTIHQLITEHIAISGDQSLNPLLNIHELPALKAQLAPGTSKQAMGVSTFIYFSANFAVMTTPVIAAMPKLSPALKNLLVGMSAISATLTMPWFGRRVDLSGGRREVVMLRAASTIGPAIYTALFATTDLSNIDSFGFPYASMIVSNALTGLSLSTFPMGNNLLYCTALKDAGFTYSLFAGVSNMAPGVALLFYQATLSQLQPAYIYAISTTISALGGIAAYYGYVVSPFHALINRGLPEDKAKKIAELLGQEKFPAGANQPFWPAIWATMKDYRATMFSFMGMATSGGNYAFNLSLPFTLKNLMPDLSSQQTVVYTACISLGATTFRVVSGKLMDKFDSSKGAYSYYASAVMMIAGSSMLLFNRPLPPSLSYVLSASTIMALGYASGAAATFKNIAAASEKEKNLKPYDAGKMNVLVSTLGQSTGTWGPWYFALIAFLNEGKPKENNVDTFYLSFTLSVLATLLLLINEYRKRAPTSVCTSWAGCFQRKQTTDDAIELDSSLNAKLIPS